MLAAGCWSATCSRALAFSVSVDGMSVLCPDDETVIKGTRVKVDVDKYLLFGWTSLGLVLSSGQVLAWREQGMNGP